MKEGERDPTEARSPRARGPAPSSNFGCGAKTAARAARAGRMARARADLRPGADRRPRARLGNYLAGQPRSASRTPESVTVPRPGGRALPSAGRVTVRAADSQRSARLARVGAV